MSTSGIIAYVLLVLFRHVSKELGQIALELEDALLVLF